MTDDRLLLVDAGGGNHQRMDAKEMVPGDCH
jgi:hypothetical protein